MEEKPNHTRPYPLQLYKLLDEKKKNVKELWYFIDNNFNAQSTRGSMEQIAIKNKL